MISCQLVRLGHVIGAVSVSAYPTQDGARAADVVLADSPATLITADGPGAGLFLTNFPGTGWLDYERLRARRPTRRPRRCPRRRHRSRPPPPR